ncbi:hypothetical protein R1T16_13780 [Flavobacterium sp. DG1-102-2]|uniref:hypothetical protein n=1 Tax=Flavobacterium sp. DG1-102-2 TaxID=3081663 RepID=UPI00294A8273|nr:hypothetical protein [Flavobacterium sp. DG1-102-2]MDV6169501.1 hypothetical protein [Flavobacterium sp. DG1-102-2]
MTLKKELQGDFSYENQLVKWLPYNLTYILTHEQAKFFEDVALTSSFSDLYTVKVPKNFCLISNSKISYKFIKELTAVLLSDRYRQVEIDYHDCKSIDLSAQIFMDIILQDIHRFINKRNRHRKTRAFIKGMSGINITNPDIQKILFSVGSPAIIHKKTHYFSDIVTYKLCTHNKASAKIENAKRKEIDTTELVEYVIASLKTLNKTLTGDSLEDLSTVIGEILINAEEHSTTNYRFSTGYFQKIDNEKLDSAYGIFHLVIMNFGESIYEKFLSPECTNTAILSKMKTLSQKYTVNNWFTQKFEEETLWTLYALQEGITSVSTTKYRRGNGSIRFIESFFNLKSLDSEDDKISRLSILSGNTNIIFDGKYKISEKIVGAEKFKVMTFNSSGNIEDKPNKKYVKRASNYFPGTIITAKILISKDDIENE